jgi:hypothetical protein
MRAAMSAVLKIDWPQPHFEFFTFGKTAKMYQTTGGFGTPLGLCRW